MKISYSFGIVDLLHYGHINALLQAKEGADLHIFGLVSDEAVIDWMGTIVSNFEERKKVLENITCIDEVLFQSILDPIENLKQIHRRYPNAVITLYHGNNWKIMPSEAYLKSIGGQVVFTQYYEKMTPENVVERLNKRIINKKRSHNLISTKANTLIALKEKLKKSVIEEICVITEEAFQINRNKICQSITRQFNGKPVVVRSSSSNEDCFEKSNAGFYNSVLNVDSSSAADIVHAVEAVINSYKKDNSNNGNEQILIQTQALGVDVSGVVFTRDINLNRPYYLVNYDDNGSTDSVTSGIGGKTLWIARDINRQDIEGKWGKLLEAVSEIEKLLEDMVLDIEFAINKKGEVIIFQVRPLAANYKFSRQTNDKDFFHIKSAARFAYNRIINYYENKKMMLSDMAFWNPSEIIGSNPRNLDYSLYREIITRKAWNQGLVPMGYKEVNHDLMYKIGNKPYISLEYAFMSLIPRELDAALSLKLMQYYREKLRKNSTAHDKIEFEIVETCYDFETPDWLIELLDHGFTPDETDAIGHSLFKLTQTALLQYNKVLKNDLADIQILNAKREKIEENLSYKEDDLFTLLQYFKMLIKDLKKYGTPQFSRQARYAFIARTLCGSMVSKNYITREEMDAFMLSIETVASEFEHDLNHFLQGSVSKQVFNKKYGHLRSGTYDIRAKRYDQINFSTSSTFGSDNKNHHLKNSQKHHLNPESLKTALGDIGFSFEPDDFIDFLKNAFEQREYFKFEFTRTLSLAIEVLVKIGNCLDIDRNQMSYIEMPDILAAEFYTTRDELRGFWLTIINQRRSEYRQKTRLELPEILSDEKDIDFIKIAESRPNFITNKTITGDIVLLEKEIDADIEGKIVVLTKADPGFDWIFAKGIKGLVTKYGGVASHMAIRCAEFGIPAAIGCGEKIYSYIKGLKSIKIDSEKEKIFEWH